MDTFRQFGDQFTYFNCDYNPTNATQLTQMHCVQSISAQYTRKPNNHKSKVGSPKDGSKITCDICELTCDGVRQYSDHLRGQKHKKREARFQLLSNTSSQPGHSNITTDVLAPSNASALSDHVPMVKESKSSSKEYEDHNKYKVLPGGHFHCSTCNVTCTGLEPFRLHMSGSRHSKNMSTTSQNKTSNPHSAEQQKKSSETPCDDQPKNAPPLFDDLLGYKYLKEDKNNKGAVMSYHCELCGCRMTDATAAAGHLKGRKHKQNYKSKVDCGVQVEPKSVKRTERKLKEKMEKRLAREEFWKKKDHQMAYEIDDDLAMCDAFDRKERTFKMPFTLTDFYIMEKCKDIEMDSQHLESLFWFTDCCEKALKMVSDEFLKSSDSSDVAEDSKRVLKGTMKVGILSNAQILKEDENFRLILLVSSRPTISLLEKIYLTFPSHLRSTIDGHPNGGTTDFEVMMISEEAYLVVQMIEPYQFCINISITSMIFEEGDRDKDSKDSLDVLNSEACLESLQQLRRAEWLQIRSKYLNEGLKIMKILRHLKTENDIWSCISEWANELLVNKCTLLQGLSSNPSSIMRCYMEVLSSGILLDGMGLIDPCEKNSVDLFEHLTAQQRENITICAQDCLRLLVYRQAYKFLNVQKVTKKRKLESEEKNAGPAVEKKTRLDGPS